MMAKKRATTRPSRTPKHQRGSPRGEEPSAEGHFVLGRRGGGQHPTTGHRSPNPPPAPAARRERAHPQPPRRPVQIPVLDEPTAPGVEVRILAALAKAPTAVTGYQLAELMGQTDVHRDISGVLRRLVVNGQVLEVKPGRYQVSGTNGEWAATLVDEDGLKARLSDQRLVPVHLRFTIGSKADDVVQVLIGEDGQALVTRILRRSGREVVGTIQFKPGGAVLVCDNRREGFLPVFGTFPGFDDQYRAGARYIGTIEVNHRGDAGVVITRALKGDAPEVADFQYVCSAHDLPGDFPAEVEAQAKAYPKRFVKGKREDLRKTLVWTIDPATAKDFDDAISLEKDDQGRWILGVHIADVSHFVTEGSPLDLEAQTRGTSCYLINRVIPMLPEVLSNGLCSLVPNQPRYCLTAFLTIDRTSELVHTRLAETIIDSRHRFTYEEAMDVLVGRDPKGKWPDDVRQAVRETGTLAQLLRRNREKAGALNLFSVEHRFRLDVEGNPIEATQESSDESHQLIEECMLLANRAVASWLEQQGLPCVYRIHEEPDAERLEQFGSVLEVFGKDSSRIRNRMGLQKILKELAQEPQGPRLVFNYLCLRSFKKAVYSIDNIGHYALAFGSYAHFTSPIRRYPDLLVHRLVKRGLKLAAYKATEIRATYLDALAKQASYLEQRAEGAERDLHARKSCRYLAKRIGEVMSAVVVGAHPGGLSVTLLETGMEGTVPLRELKDDYYDFDQKTISLVGRRSRRVLGSGAELDVRIDAVDVERADVVFGIDQRGAPGKAIRTPVQQQRSKGGAPAPAPAPAPVAAPARAAVPAVTPAPVRETPPPRSKSTPRVEPEVIVLPPAAVAVIDDTPADLDEHPDVPGFHKPLPIDRSVDRRRLPPRWRGGRDERKAR